MANYFIYNHGGSGNHGCEALLRTVLKLFEEDASISVLSESPQQDIRYGLNSLLPVLPATSPVSKLSPQFASAYIALKTKGNYTKIDCLPYLSSIRKLSGNMIELSIGGDIYCYEDYRKFILLHEKITKKGCKSVLLGCSLEEDLFLDPLFLEDMKRYRYISARESLTYTMLKNAGLSNIGLAPDSAFTLPTEKLPLPAGFAEGNTIGINLSPLVLQKEPQAGITLENYVHLIRYILEHTDCSVALIPHVVWHSNDDRTVLQTLYNIINCPDRVVLIDDCNCMQLKGYISRCRFFIGARTHATIAAYSSLIPTLVLGYSVKSRGIATDLFGTDKNYVLPIQQLHNTHSLTDSFRWLMENEQQIRSHLASIIPTYVAKVYDLKTAVTNTLENT